MNVHMQRVVGLDLSLTSSGIAVVTSRAGGDCIANTTSITSRGRRNDGLPERAQRIAGLAVDIDRAVGSAVLALVEAPAYAAKGGSPVDRHHLWFSVVDRLINRGVVVVSIPPTKLKLAIAGKGNADKGAVAGAVTRLWPDVELANADEGDALGLAHLGATRLGWNVQTLQRHLDCLASIRWPELPTAPAVA